MDTSSSASYGASPKSQPRLKVPSNNANYDDDSVAEKQKNQKGNSASNRVQRHRQTIGEVDGSAPINKLEKEVRKRASARGTDLATYGMCEEQFRNYAKSIGMPDDVCDKCIQDVHKLVNTIGEHTDDEISQIKKVKDEAEVLKKLSVGRATCRQFFTTSYAGWVAYTTSFFLGKLATSLSTIPIGAVHGGWAFLVAGFLNPALSEPLAQGIRSTGVAYASPDGKAYMDYHTASLWLKQVEGNKGLENKWRKERADIVLDVLKREHAEKMDRLGSGIKEITFDKNCKPISAKTCDGGEIDPEKAMNQVIDAAQHRAYITDELPFFSFTLNYLISGSFAPLFKKNLTTWGYLGADLGLSAFLGSLSGMETATIQNGLRAHIQGAQRTGLTHERKRALRTVTTTKLSIIERKLYELSRLRRIFVYQESYLQIKLKEGHDVSNEIEALHSLQNDTKKARTAVRKQYKKCKREVKRHFSLASQGAQAVNTSMSTYMGELAGNTDTFKAEAMTFRAAAKLIAYPLSLVPVVLYNTLVAPAIVDAFTAPSAQPSLTNPSLTNTSMAAFSPSVASVDSAAMNAQMVTSALFGIPLIIGWTLRQQYLTRWTETALVKMFGSKSRRDLENDNGSVKSGEATKHPDSAGSAENDDGSVIIELSTGTKNSGSVKSKRKKYDDSRATNEDDDADRAATSDDDDAGHVATNQDDDESSVINTQRSSSEESSSSEQSKSSEESKSGEDYDSDGSVVT